MPIDSDMVKRAVRAFDAAVDSHRGLGTGDFTAMRAALEASGLPDQNARLVEELSEAKKEITDTQDRLAQIEQSLEALADRMRIADENLTHDGRHREAQFVRDWLSDVRAIIDTQKDGDDG